MNFSTSGHFDQISAKKNFSTLEFIGDRIFDADQIFKKKKNQKGRKEQFLDFFSPLIQSLML